MAATIKIKNSSTASAVPTSSDLVQGELAVNVTDKRIFTENASGTVVELGTNPSILTLPDGSASAPTLTNDGDTNTGIFFPAADTVGISTGGTERARVDSSGNMGLGVTPSAWASTWKPVQLALTGFVAGRTDAERFYAGSNAYYNGTNWIYTSNGKATYYASNLGQHEWYNATTGTAGGTISFTQAMTLDASGNLLVGTTSALYGAANRGVIEVNGSSTAIVALKIGNSYGGYTYHDGTVMSVSNILNGALAFATNGSERARIDSSGNLLVGTTSVPGAGSATTGASFGAGGYISVQRSASTPCFFGRSNDGEVMALYSGTTQRGQVSISGATTTYGSFSDYRLKENIIPLTGAVAKVMALKPSTFNFIEFPEQTINGFIAHEVAEIEPIAVTGQKDAVDEEGKQLYQSVDPAKLVPLLTAAFQELKAELDSNKREFDAYKASHP